MPTPAHPEPALWLIAIVLAVFAAVLLAAVFCIARLPRWWLRRRRARVDRPGFPVVRPTRPNRL